MAEKKEEGRGNVKITVVFYTNSRATHKKTKWYMREMTCQAQCISDGINNS